MLHEKDSQEGYRSSYNSSTSRWWLCEDSSPYQLKTRHCPAPEAPKSGIQRFLLPDRQGQCLSALKQLWKMGCCPSASQKNMGIKSLKEEWNRREEGSAKPLKEWHSPWGYIINWLEPTRFKIMEDLTSSRPWASLHACCILLACDKWNTYHAKTVLRLTIKGQKMGSGPILGNFCPFPEMVGIILQLVSLWNYPVHKN